MHTSHVVGLHCERCCHSWAVRMPETQPELVELVQHNKHCPRCESIRVLLMQEAA